MDYNKLSFNCNISYTFKHYTVCHLIHFSHNVYVNHKAQTTKTLCINLSRSTSAIPKEDLDTNLIKYVKNYAHVSFSWEKSLLFNVPLLSATNHEQGKFSLPRLVMSNETY